MRTVPGPQGDAPRPGRLASRLFRPVSRAVSRHRHGSPQPADHPAEVCVRLTGDGGFFPEVDRMLK
jgi:hypothetical protein